MPNTQNTTKDAAKGSPATGSSMHIERFKHATRNIPSQQTLEWLHARGLNPFHFTFLSLVFKILTVILFIQGEVVWGGFTMFLEYVFDGIDGRMARGLRLTSTYGLFADLVGDRIFRSMYLVALPLGGLLSWEWAAAALLIDIVYATVSDLVRDRKLKAAPWGLDSFRVLAFAAPLNLIQLGMIVKFTVGTALLISNIAYIAIANRHEATTLLQKARKERKTG